ncbi:MAG: hypothetical protein LUH45_03900 [Clostridiales bacterium]|nr:hypothetical protein [Clostridiales bacterium]
MLKRTARQILAWSVVFAMLFSLTAQPAAAADVSADTSAPVYSAQADEDAAEETTEAEPAEEEAENDPADDTGETDESAEESADASSGADSGETEEEPADEPAEESADESADESGEEAMLTLGATANAAAAASEEEEEEEEAETTVTASAYSYDSYGFYTSGSTAYYEPAEKNSSGYYEISNAGQLFWYAALTRGATSQEGITKQVLNGKAVLTNDISIPIGYTWIPGSDITGTFDGAGYTISGIYINSSSDYQGLFSQVASGGTVKNLTISGSITGSSYTGGIAGQCCGTISSCINLATIKGNDYVGGITGVLKATNGGGVTNCCNFGTVNGVLHAAGIVGWNDGIVTNCYNVATVTASFYGASAVCYNYFGKNSNCYYMSSLTEVEVANSTGKTAAQFASGEVAYLLNGSKSGGTTWYQNIDNGETADSWPLPYSSHGKVYYGYSCTSTTAGYSNYQWDNNQGHTYDDDGFCVKCGAYEPATLKNGVYQIENAGNLFWFAALVNGSTSNAEFDAQNTGANAVLTCDIDLSVTTDTHTGTEWTPIGNSSSEPYSGTFDGKGYTVSGLYCYSISTAQRRGLFGYVTGTVQNVGVSGTVRGLMYVGGLVGSNAGEISNCYSTVTVSGSTALALYVGGIAGYNSGTITNCYSIGAVSDRGTYVGSVVGKSGGTITNCYYLDTLLADDYATTKTEDEFASGEVAYLLNESVSGGTSWYQNIDNGKTVDSYPVLSSSHGTVYTYTNCLGVSAYSNTERRNADHQYDSDGFCSVCGAYEPATLKNGVYQISNAGQMFWFSALVNGDTTQEDISEAVSSANAVLTADIDLSVTTSTHTSTNWTPIGNYVSSTSLTYTGTFDGDGHTISGLYINGTRNYQGLFGCVGSGGTVQNVAVSGSVTGFYYVGGVVGYNCYGTVTGCTNSATTKGIYYVGGVVGCNIGAVTNSYNIGTVASSNSSYYSSYLGGVVCLNRATVTNCYSTGAISGYRYVGGVVGGNYNSGCTVTSCYNTGEVSGTTSVGGLIGTNSGTVTNCYYLDTVGSDSYATAKTSDEFASGEVAWLLNGSVNAGTTWRQNLDNGETVDTCPVLDSTHGTVYCGYTSCTVTTATYSNTKLSITQQGHSYDDDGFCTNCGAYEPAELNSDGYYEIDNAGNLFWFAALVNGYSTITVDETEVELEGITEAVPDAKAILTADIDLGVTTNTHTSNLWTPIGDEQAGSYSFERNFKGVFDGQGHTISGLTIDSTNDGQGLFGFINRGTVQDLVLADVDISGGGYVGALAGTVYSGTITNVSVTGGTISATGSYAGGIVGMVRTNAQVSGCYSAAAVTATGGTYAGGITGRLYNNSTITNSYNTGAITGGQCVGGLVGDLSSLSVTNCYSTGAVSGTSSVGALVGTNSGTVTNCYYLDTVGSDDYATAKTSDEFASGEVAWLLQNGQSSQVWGQTLTGDANKYPVLTSDSADKVVQVAFYLVKSGAVSDTALQTRYINYNTALDEYPKSETTTYSFYTDEACTKALDTTAYTYTTDTTVYVKSTVTATVCVNGAEKSITVEEGETYDLTELVPSGYLYGGAFTDSNYETVIDTKTCGSGKAFTPQAGETYYVKLVDGSYFMIRCLLAYEHYVPTNLWLVTNIDTAENYKLYGFDITVDGDSYAVTTDTAAESLETSFDLDGKTYNGFVDISDFTGFSDNDIDESGKTNLVGCVELGEKGENKFASLLKAGSFTVVPFFVTADGVKVTGAVNRTITLASGTTSVDDMYDVGDVTAASETEVYTGNTANATMLMSASLNVVSSMYITNITDENTDTDTGDETETETEPEPDLTTCTITVHDGDKVSTLEVDIGAADVTVEYTQPDGCLFAGWFTDEGYTTAADFSEVSEDMTVYAKYVSSDYMQVKASTVSSKGVLKSIRMISATDSKNYAEVGFVYTYSDTEGSATAKYAASISGKTAKNLYGGGVGTGSKLIYADLSISGMEADTAVTITPYWVTLDGTTVYGAERTITYTGSGIE